METIIERNTVPSDKNAEIAQLFQFVVSASAENEASFSHAIATALENAIGEPAPHLSITECHVIEAIGTTPSITAAEIAENLGMTRGGISKMIKRLEKKGYLATGAKADNKKEIDLALTPLGKAAYQAHAQLHEQKLQRLMKRLDAYTDAEKDIIVRLLHDITSEIESSAFPDS